MAEKILVTGATGTIGKALIKALQQKNATVVAGVTSQEKGRTVFGKETPFAVLNYENPATFADATAGVTKVFLLGPPLRTDLEQLITPFIRHLKDAGIRRVVYVGALGLDLVKELPFHTNIIKLIQQNGFDNTILLPSFFAQNFRNYDGENILQRGITFAPAGNGKAAFVDVEDIALAAATVLTSEGHSGKTYELTGPETLSYAEVAELLSEVLERKIHYPNPSADEYRQALQQAGAPTFIADYMIAVYSLIANNLVNEVSDHVYLLTGKKPTPLREVLQRDFAAVKKEAVSA